MLLNAEELLSVAEFQQTGETDQLLAPDLTNLSQETDLYRMSFIYFVNPDQNYLKFENLRRAIGFKIHVKGATHFAEQSIFTLSCNQNEGHESATHGP